MILEQLKLIWFGWYNFIYYKLGRIDDPQLVAEYERKRKVCNSGCPLFSMGFCSSFKEHNGTNGCGCFTKAKNWIESACPLERY